MIDDKTLEMLIKLAHKAEIEKSIKSLFNGEKVNLSENKAAMHTALRADQNNPSHINGNSIIKPINDNLKQALIEAKETDTMLALRSVGNTHRFWNNKAAQHVLELEAQGSPLFMLIQAASGDKAEKMYKEGDIDLGVVSCGQGVGLVRDIPTVKELLDRTMSEAEEIISRLSKLSK